MEETPQSLLMMIHKLKIKGEGYYDVVNYYRFMCCWDGYFRR